VGTADHDRVVACGAGSTLSIGVIVTLAEVPPVSVALRLMSRILFVDAAVDAPLTFTLLTRTVLVLAAGLNNCTMSEGVAYGAKAVMVVLYVGFMPSLFALSCPYWLTVGLPVG
jgi:hypothetical protein